MMQLVETYFKFVFVKQNLKLISFGIALGHNKTINVSKHKALMLFMIKKRTFLMINKEIMGSNKNDGVTLMLVKRTLEWMDEGKRGLNRLS